MYCNYVGGLQFECMKFTKLAGEKAPMKMDRILWFICFGLISGTVDGFVVAGCNRQFEHT